jgi:histone acetyltransferase (RNA polymerase elongator complex component)
MAASLSSIGHPISGIKQDRPFIIPIFIPHAGCPHRCVFCNQSSITGVDSKPPNIGISDQVARFLKFKGKRRDFVQVAFFGGNFLGIQPDEMKRLLTEAAEFVQAGYASSIRFSTRPDTVDGHRLNMIKEFPVATVELGVQSMDNRVLSATKRGHTASDTEKAIQRLKKLNYEIGLQLMVGLPCDTPARLRASARRIVRLKPDFIRIYPTVVLADSPLAKWYQTGRYTPLSLKEAVSEVKDIYRIFKNENIRVIRMGLQATEDLEKDSTILAGPYHPAFGHLVYSAIFLDMAIAALKSDKTKGGTVAFHVHPHSISKMRGLENKNINILKEQFKLKSVKVIPDASLGQEQVQVK